MNRALRDGYEVHRAALAHGYNVTLLPRQVMEVSKGDRTVTTSFSHGVPQQTTLAAVTYAQDVRMRRDMVMRAGYTVPTGATFSMGGSRKAAFRYAARTLGYPVVVKPAVGDNTVDVIPGVDNHGDLQRALEYFHTPPTERPGYTRAAFALTELREPGLKDGRIVVPPGYRFLVEKQVAGQYLRFLVVGRNVINVLLCPDGPWRSQPEEVQDVTDQVHQSLKDIAVETTAAIPGVSVAAIDIVTADHRVLTEIQDAPIVEYSERPWLEVQHATDPNLAADLGTQILKFGVGENLSETKESISIDFTIDGSVHPGDLLVALQDECRRLGLRVQAEVSDPAMGHVTGNVHGPSKEIAWIMESLLADGIDGQRAMLVESRQVGFGRGGQQSGSSSSS